MKKIFEPKEYKTHCISYLNVKYLSFVFLGTATGFLYLYKPLFADKISYEFIGEILMIKLLTTFFLKVLRGYTNMSSIFIKYIISKLVDQTIKSALTSSLFFLGFAIFLFIYDSAPHGTLALYGCIYFFCFSEVLSTPFTDQKSAIHSISMGVIIAIPFSPLDRLL